MANQPKPEILNRKYPVKILKYLAGMPPNVAFVGAYFALEYTSTCTFT